ncbi:MAG TPA: hypothetical protein VGO86_18835 [Candidatus Dormibacteraeota bacterium]
MTAACGATNPYASSPGASSARDQLVKFAQCMRAHGVNVSDPNANGDLTQPAPSGGPDPQQVAQTYCRQYAPNGGQPPPPPNAQQLDKAVKYAQCMRQHGINLPDPDSNGSSEITRSSGIDPNSTQFQQAQQACKQYAPGSGTAVGG